MISRAFKGQLATLIMTHSKVMYVIFGDFKEDAVTASRNISDCIVFHFPLPALPVSYSSLHIQTWISWPSCSLLVNLKTRAVTLITKCVLRRAGLSTEEIYIVAAHSTIKLNALERTHKDKSRILNRKNLGVQLATVQMIRKWNINSGANSILLTHYVKKKSSGSECSLSAAK